MADKVDVQVTGKSNAEIAYLLMQDVMRVEKRDLHHNGSGEPADREYILKVFSDCMYAIMNPSYRSS